MLFAKPLPLLFPQTAQDASPQALGSAVEGVESVEHTLLWSLLSLIIVDTLTQEPDRPPTIAPSSLPLNKNP